MAPPMGKSVRFDDVNNNNDAPNNNHKRRHRDPSGSGGGALKRHRPDHDDDNDDDDDGDKKPRGIIRMNVDGDDDDGVADIPSEHELLEAKRRRREKQKGVSVDDDDDDEKEQEHQKMDHTTSLAAEGIAIEPFHMRQEESDGTGFFDGDTYVFRKNADFGEEPDAWLDALREDAEKNPQLQQQVNNASKNKKNGNSSDDDDEDDDNDEDNPGEDKTSTDEQLYETILPLIGASESVSQAIRRYGKLVKQQQQPKNNHGKKQTTTKSEMSSSQLVAKKKLDDLTGAASQLLLKGQVNIYETTRKDIGRLYPELLVKTKEPPAQWEYVGNQDDQTHGPYTTQEMMGWIQAGYFTGDQKVKIRTVRKPQDDNGKEKEEPPKSTQEDLLSDLLSDDDDDDADGKDGKPKSDMTPKEPEKGPWMWSTEVDFSNYLP